MTIIMGKYNFGLNWENTREENFISFLKRACHKRKLSFFWINKENIEQVIKQLQEHKIKIDVLLDGEATFNKKDDLYMRACYAVKDNGGTVINDPDRTRIAIDKSVIHFELLNAGIETPNTVIARNWEPDNFRLTDKEKNLLGKPFVIKPAYGYGQKGLVRQAMGTQEEIGIARDFDREDNFLLQEKIKPIVCSGRRAWFRIMNVFDAIIPCWWDDQTNLYEHVSLKEFKLHDLKKAVRIAIKIAEISRMSWFSTEIAIDNKFKENRFVVIDYINDQCDLTTKYEASGGVPDNIVKYVTNKIITKAHQYISGKSLSRRYTIFLKDARISYKKSVISQDLLRSCCHR